MAQCACGWWRMLDHQICLQDRSACSPLGKTVQMAAWQDHAEQQYIWMITTQTIYNNILSSAASSRMQVMNTEFRPWTLELLDLDLEKLTIRHYCNWENPVECTGDYSEKLNLDWVDTTKSLPTKFLVIHPPMLVDCMIILHNIATKTESFEIRFKICCNSCSFRNALYFD